MATTEEAKLNVIVQMKDKLSPGMKKSAKQTQKLTSNLKQMRMGLLAVAAASTAVVVASTKQFVAFDKGMREVNTLLDINETQFVDLSRQVRQLSLDMGVDAVGATKSLYTAISAGIPAENAVSFIGSAAKLSIGGVTDLETATDGLKTVINAYGLEVSETTRVSDTLFETVRLGSTTIGELSRFMFQSIPTAAAFGVSLEEIAAATALVTQQGSPTANVMTGLRAAMISLVKPTSEMTALLNKMGFESGGTALKTLGLQKTLQGLLEAADGSKDALTAAGLQAESLAVVFGITGENARKFDEFLLDITDSAGATEAAFQKMEDSAAQDFAKMNATLTETKLLLGEALLPVILDVVEGINGIAKGLEGLSEGQIKTLGGLILGIGSLAAIGVVAPAVITGFTLVAGVIAAIAGAASVAGVGLLALAAAGATLVLSSNSTLKAVEKEKKAFAVNTSAWGRYEEKINGVTVAYRAQGTAMDHFDRQMNRREGFDSRMEQLSQMETQFGDFHITLSKVPPAMREIASAIDDIVASQSQALDDAEINYSNFGDGLIAKNQEALISFQWMQQSIDNALGGIAHAEDEHQSQILFRSADFQKKQAEILEQGVETRAAINSDAWMHARDLARNAHSDMMNAEEEHQLELQMLAGKVQGLQTALAGLGLSYQDVNLIMGETGLEFETQLSALGELEEMFIAAGVGGDILVTVMESLKDMISKTNEEVGELLEISGIFNQTTPISTFNPNQGLTGIDLINRQAIKNLKDAGTFTNYDPDFAGPTFGNGGVVGGAIGSPQMIMAHGGETVLPTHKRGMGMAGITVNIPNVTGVIMDTQIPSLVDEAMALVSGSSQNSFEVGAANVSWAE